jgi:hypothetical protein
MKKTKSQIISDLVKTLLGEDDNSEVTLVQETLEDGTIVEYADLVNGEPIFVVLPEGNQPLTDGEYTIKDKVIKVTNGLIEEVKPEETKPEEPATTETKQSAEEIKLAIEKELKSKFENDLKLAKEKYDAKILELAKSIKDSGIIQSPNTEKESKPMSAKEFIMKSIEDKKNNK